MRVGLVGPLPPPTGGMANQTRQLERLLRAAGVDVHTVRTNEPYRPTWIRAVKGARAVFRLVPYCRRLAEMTARVDVVHVMANSGWAWRLFAAPAIRAAARRGVPIIVNYRGGLAREFLVKSAGRVLPTMRLASALVVPSGFLRSVFSEYGIEAEIIPNIVDLERFRQDDQRPSESFHVVIARNLEPIYGIDTAIRAVAALRAQYPALRVSIAGAGPERRNLERLAIELGVEDAIHFTGSLEADAVAELYRNASVALNPSRVDNAPNSLIEAAACGLPIVSTDVGGVSHLVEHGSTAWLVPPDDPSAMARGLARVWSDGTLRRTLCANSRTLARSFGWETVGPRWLALYGRVAGNKKST